MKFQAEQIQETILLVVIGGSVVGLMFGGIYSWPAIHFTKGREPWLSLLLAAGLSVTVFGLGLPADVPLLYLGVVWIVALVLLIAARRFFGALDHNLERFGLVHATALLATLVVISFLSRDPVSGGVSAAVYSCAAGPGPYSACLNTL